MNTRSLFQRFFPLFNCLIGVCTGAFSPQAPFAQDLTPTPRGDVVRAEVYDVYDAVLDGRKEHVVYLRDPAGKRFLPIWIGTCEAQAIWRKLHGVDFPRPLTHDLFKSFLDATGIRITSILVDQLRPLTGREGRATYFAVLTLQQVDGKFLQIDSRPSDAMALAVRIGLPVFISRKIIEENGVPESDAPIAPPRNPPPAEAPGNYY